MAHQTQPFSAHARSGETAGALHYPPHSHYSINFTLNESLPHLESRRASRSVYAEDSPQEILALYSLERDEPIRVRGASRIVLGRSEPDEPPPTVDLTDLDGVRLGVSRKHAIILCADGVQTIQDLDSANGTYLNGERLLPFRPYRLRSTDQLQLGLLRLAVLFQRGGDTPAEPVLVDRIVLDVPPGVMATPHALGRMVMPFLDAVSCLQQVRDEAMGQPPRQVKIDRIEAGPATIAVRCRGAGAAVRLLEDVIGPWQARSADLLYAVRDEPDNETWRQALQDAEVHLAMAVLDSMAPDVGLAARLHYATRLIPALDTLVRSEITLRTDCD